jgi:hypothetical protein
MSYTRPQNMKNADLPHAGMDGRCPSSRGWFLKHPCQPGVSSIPCWNDAIEGQLTEARPPRILNETLYRCRENMLVIDLIKHRRKD